MSEASEFDDRDDDYLEWLKDTVPQLDRDLEEE